MTLPKISIVVCSYNGEKYIAAQIHTLLQQSLQPFEIIIVDDASSDNSCTILKKLEVENPLIKLYCNEINKGFNKNFEYALSLATGDFIAISDQDDIWAPKKLEFMMSAYNGKADIIHCNSKITASPEKFIFYSKQISNRFEGNNLKQLLFFNTVEGHCMILKRDFLQKAIPFPKSSYYDWWLAMQACLHNGVQWYNNTLVARRLHDNNASVKELALHGKKVEIFQTLKNINPYLTKESEIQKLVAQLISLLQNSQKIDTLPLEKLISNNYEAIFFFKKSFSKILNKKKNIKKLLDAIAG